MGSCSVMQQANPHSGMLQQLLSTGPVQCTSSRSPTPTSNLVCCGLREVCTQTSALVVEHSKEVPEVSRSLDQLQALHKVYDNLTEAMKEYEVNSHCYNVCIIDLSIHVMDGLTTALQIRGLEKRFGLERILILARVSSTLSINYQQGVEVGIDAYLSDSTSLKHLVAALSIAAQDADTDYYGHNATHMFDK